MNEEHIRGVSEDGPRLGETGVPYRSEAAESLVAERMQQLRASGRPAERMAVLEELVGAGKIAAWHDDRSGFEAELLNSLTPEQRRLQSYSQDFQRKADAPMGGQTLAESRLIALSQHQSKLAQERASSARRTGSTDRKLSEADRREQLVRSWTRQGYALEDARMRADFTLREEARARGEK